MSEYTLGAVEYTALTASDVKRLNRESSVSVPTGDKLFILEKSPILGQTIMKRTASGTLEIVFDKEGNPIRDPYTIGVVLHQDGTMSTGKASLAWIAGEDLTSDRICPLEWCKEADGTQKRKYAKTFGLAPLSTRDFSLPVTEGMDEFAHTMVFLGCALVTGYKVPAFRDIWERKSDGSYGNKEGVLEKTELELTRVTRTSLQYLPEDNTDAETLKKMRLLVDAAIRMLAPKGERK